MTFLFRCDAQIKQSLPLKRNKLIVLKLVLKKHYVKRLLFLQELVIL